MMRGRLDNQYVRATEPNVADISRAYPPTLRWESRRALSIRRMYVSEACTSSTTSRLRARQARPHVSMPHFECRHHRLVHCSYGNLRR